MKLIFEDSLPLAASCLREGGLVAFPTETVYGLGANALDPIAVAKIFEAKKRPTFDPLIVHIASFCQVTELFSSPIDPLVEKLALHFMPGPITIVHKKTNKVSDLITGGLETVAIRMPNHPLAIKLIEMAGTPIAAPSANLFGHLSPTHFEHVIKQQMPIDYVIGCKQTEEIVGIESTVVLIERGELTILRPGAITADDILKIYPDTIIHKFTKNTQLHSPGLLKSHYSPRKPLYFLPNNLSILPENSGLITHHQEADKLNARKVICTSKKHLLVEIAAHLFSSLHAMEDDPNISQIYIQPIEEKGIGVAIMDRLKKATFQYQK